MKLRVLSAFTVAVGVALVLALAAVAQGAAGTPLQPGSLAPAAFVYLPYVARQPSQLSPTPTATSQPTGPPAPAQVAPVNGAMLDTISPAFAVDNSALGQPAWAQLRYAPAQDPSDVDGFVIAPFQGSSTPRLYWNLSQGTTYLWRVRSSWDGATWGPWSGDWSFTTATGGTFPGVPTLISPPDQSTVGSLRPTVTWSPVSGATGYALALGDFVFMLTPPLNAFTMGFDLDPSSTYGWSASARNVYGWGARSNEWTFTTPAAQGMSGAGHAATTGPVFEGEGALWIRYTGSD